MSLKQFSARKFCLEWRTKLPGHADSCGSPVFVFRNSEWQLILERTWKEAESEDHWNLYLKKLQPSSDILMLRVAAYIKRENATLRQVFDESCVFSSPVSEQIFWFGRPLLSEECIARMDDEMTIFFTLDAPLLSVADLKEDSEIEKQSLESLSQNMEELFYSEEYSDITLNCAGEQFRAHRNILCARSELLASIIKGDMSSGGEEAVAASIDIVDMPPWTLRLFLEYLYSGKISEALTVETAEELLRVADLYEVLPLKRECSAFIAGNLTEGNLCNAFVLAKEFGDSQLMDSAVTFLDNHEGYFQTGTWNAFVDWQPVLAVEVCNEFSRRKKAPDESSDGKDSVEEVSEEES